MVIIYNCMYIHVVLIHVRIFKIWLMILPLVAHPKSSAELDTLAVKTRVCRRYRIVVMFLRAVSVTLACCTSESKYGGGKALGTLTVLSLLR